MKRSHIYRVLFGTAMILGTGSAAIAQDNVTEAAAAAAAKARPATISNRPFIPLLPVQPPVAPPPEVPATPAPTATKISIVEQPPYTGVIYSVPNRPMLSLPQAVSPATPKTTTAPVEKTGVMVETPKPASVEVNVPAPAEVWTPNPTPAVVNDVHENVPAVDTTPREGTKPQPSGNAKVTVDNIPAGDALVPAPVVQTSKATAVQPTNHDRTRESMAARYRAEAAAAIPETFKDPAHLYAAQAALQMRDVENGSRNALMADLGAYVKAQGAATQAINCGNTPQTPSDADRSDASLEAELMRLMFTKAECSNHARYLAERRDALSRELRRRHEAREAEARRQAEAQPAPAPAPAPAPEPAAGEGNGNAATVVDKGPYTQITSPDGTTELVWPDGTRLTEYPDGSLRTIFRDGSVSVEKNGTLVHVRTDGSVEVTRDGTRTRTYPDGSRTIVGPDGTTTQIEPNGRTTVTPPAPR